MAATALVLPPTTPPDYHRIVSPTLRIPTDPQTSIPVGLLACQRDPLLRELATTVVSSQPAAAPPQPKRAKKGTAAPPSEPLVEVVLHDTVLFPEGGGQPSDIGFLTSADGEVWEVAEVKRFGGHAVHYVKVGSKGIEAALAAFKPAEKIGVALGEAGLNRRLDHMCMHTSQHLLSAVLENTHKIPTLSWSLTTYPTPSYVEISRAVSAEEIAAVQEECNKYVFEGRKVHIEVEDLDSEGRVYRGTSKGIPDDYTGGVRRVVIIDGIDKNPCCGTHVPTLHNLQLFILPQTETLSRANTASARLYFLAGPRLITHLTTTQGLLTTASSIMSCGAPQVPERITQVVEDRKRATKRVEDVELELAGLLAKDMLASAVDGAQVVAHKHRVDDSVNPLGFLTNITTIFMEQAAARPDPLNYLVVLSSSPSMQTTTSVSTVMVVGSDDKKVKDVGEALKSKLGVKGGGKGTRWSGKFIGVWKDTRDGALVEEILKEKTSS